MQLALRRSLFNFSEYFAREPYCTYLVVEDKTACIENMHASTDLTFSKFICELLMKDMNSMQCRGRIGSTNAKYTLVQSNQFVTSITPYIKQESFTVSKLF